MSTEFVLADLLRKMAENFTELAGRLAGDMVKAAEQLEAAAAAQTAPFSPLVSGLTISELEFLGARLCPAAPPHRQPDIIASSPALTEVANILVLTAKHFGFSLPEMMEGGRSRERARARHYAMWLIYHMPDAPARWSFPNIGKLFQVDHSTAKHGVDVVDGLRKGNAGAEVTRVLDGISRLAHTAARLSDADPG